MLKNLYILPIVTLFSKQISLGQILALSCIIGGGMRNIYDRITYGIVVDFMNIGISSLRTAMFNFADVSIMLGLFLLLDLFDGNLMGCNGQILSCASLKLIICNLG